MMEEGCVSRAAHFLAARKREGMEEKRERERSVAQIHQEVLFKDMPQVTSSFQLCPNS